MLHVEIPGFESPEPASIEHIELLNTSIALVQFGGIREITLGIANQFDTQIHVGNKLDQMHHELMKSREMPLQKTLAPTR